MSKTSPDVGNYLLGKGVVYFDRFNSAGAQTGEMDLGNTPNFSITPNVESIDHFSSREGLKKKDKSVDTGLGYTVKFTADEFSRNNLNLFLLGDGTEGSETQTAGAVGNESVTARHDKWVKLTYRSVSNVVVTNSTGVTTYTEDTDYSIDYATGRIKALSTGSITDAQALLVDYHYASVTYSTIAAGMTSTIEGFLRFIGNPEVGPKYEVEVWKCKLKPVGDLKLIGDDWGTLDMEAEILEDDANHPTESFFSVIDITTNDTTVS